MSTFLDEALKFMGATPRPLSKFLSTLASLEHDDPCTVDEIRSDVALPKVGSLGVVFYRHLGRWDYLDPEEAPWTSGTARGTLERRERIYSLLEIDVDFGRLLSERFQPPEYESPTVIADQHELWYPPQALSTFYWDAYTRQLSATPGWSPVSIASLEESTRAVVARLSSPSRTEANQTKGLVVGYVQSGKTANFTGVIARAADAGYRLFIVLAGLHDVLREQTQRRVDKELIGKELLAADSSGNEYVSDSEWRDFVSHGSLPSVQGSFDWLRLTGPGRDYQSLGKGVDVLGLERPDPQAPAYSQANLARSRARLVIVKKNARVLERLLDDLKALSKRGKGRLADIPALIIDDESDQASVNTKKPKKEQEERSKVNAAIRDLLQLMPRAQYLGYTATPFANVLINPKDKSDIFPRDYLLSLVKPPGYMGVAEFFDVVDRTNEGLAVSNEKAFVRNVRGADSAAMNLQKALDSFVLAGAIKLFRLKANPEISFKHHTMLVHSSSFNVRQTADAEAVKQAFRKAKYGSTEAETRLQVLFESDFRPVSEARATGLSFPSKYTELKEHIKGCIERLESQEKMIRVVNRENQGDAPDFERESVWGILVGGNKLSRGYTVEGLTISYYRRTAQASDTLMQMGRWFGFRRGYGDLVRLFVGRAEPMSRKGKKTLDLLEAFKAICLDEEAFRAELKRYSSLENPRVTPLMIPPLVPLHMLQPTSANKRYWAKAVFTNFGGRWSEKTVFPVAPASIRANQKLARRLLQKANLKPALLELQDGTGSALSSFKSYIGSATHLTMKAFLREYQWEKGFEQTLTRELDFLDKKAGDPELDDWVIVAPQLQKGKVEPFGVGGAQLSVKYRNRVDKLSYSPFKVLSEPDHRAVAEYIAGLGVGSGGYDLAKLRGARRGVMLFYPVRPEEQANEPVTPGFALLFPKNSTKAVMRYSADVD